ncbi:plasmid mobilization relaxosome protein MobC [Streptomyces kaniharaensis]|uniref:Plasmid mobilization relaxosome protein MobC n=1 Tax=Streptomyces kaniharaensis TaxID=212423 RepID=A0A6N7L0T1_9ACTN|nr:plasmid mobilization relaxosome protein MobC [Streptomyces kaniharaensis]MQS16439.1 plasmid mobilization relaxosome protein MobC [Streptomyces kaniharaensis]
MRLAPQELERWRAAQQKTSRKELGAWVRAVVEEALNGHPGVPGDVAQVPEVNHAAYLTLAQAANNLNQLTRYTHQESQLHHDIQAAIEAVGNAALAIRGLEPLDGEESGT